MDLPFFIKGLMIGFSIAAPVGPIGVLCIQRTLHQGRMSGFVSGMGAATADAIYGSIAGFGLTLISAFLIDYQGWFRLAGGLFLCYLGIRTLLARPVDSVSSRQEKSLLHVYATTFFLTLTNPMTILAFAAIFAGFGVGGQTRGFLSPLILISGVFLGSALWWLILSGGGGLFRKKFSFQAMTWVNRISGLVIVGFGLFSVIGMIGRVPLSPRGVP